MKFIIKTLILTALISSQSIAGPHYLSGKITNLTSIRGGLLIMLDSGVPDNCVNTPSGLMMVRQEDTAMTSVVLAVWLSGSKQGTVYTEPHVPGQYCTLTQFDPVN